MTDFSRVEIRELDHVWWLSQPSGLWVEAVAEGSPYGEDGDDMWLTVHPVNQGWTWEVRMDDVWVGEPGHRVRADGCMRERGPNV